MGDFLTSFIDFPNLFYCKQIRREGQAIFALSFFSFEHVISYSFIQHLFIENLMYLGTVTGFDDIVVLKDF